MIQDHNRMLCSPQQNTELFFLGNLESGRGSDRLLGEMNQNNNFIKYSFLYFRMFFFFYFLAKVIFKNDL